MFRKFVRALALALAACGPLPAAQIVTDTNASAPKVAAASDEGERAMKRFRIPKGFKVELFAAEPQLSNPVAFTIDEHGRFFVAETFRLHAGVTDVRGHRDWLDNDLANRTTEDLAAMFQRFLGPKVNELTNNSERVQLIEDRDGDGRADHS